MKLILLIIAFVPILKAQDTISIPVIYYDFHSDRSNPEFEQPFDAKDSFCVGMVQDTLDSEGKPVLKNSCRNDYIKYWFRDWKDSAKGDFSIPDYKYYNFNKDTILSLHKNMDWFLSSPDGSIEELEEYNGKSAIWPLKTHYLNGNIDDTNPPPFMLNYYLEWYADVKSNSETKILNHDTSFKNIVIHDTLCFIRKAGSSAFIFDSPQFHPLDKKGFCSTKNDWHIHDAFFLMNHNMWVESPEDSLHPEDVDHNYSFTMELEYPFVMTEGLKIKIEGNDDIWVFVDGQLQLDLGGIHTRASGEILFDTISSIEIGRTYTLKIFLAERHSTGASLKIETISNDVSVTPKASSINKNSFKIVQLNDKLLINAPFNDGIITIYNAAGRVLSTQEFTQKHIGENFLINRSFKKGVYFIKVINTDGKAYYSQKCFY